MYVSTICDDDDDDEKQNSIKMCCLALRFNFLVELWNQEMYKTRLNNVYGFATEMMLDGLQPSQDSYHVF